MRFFLLFLTIINIPSYGKELTPNQVGKMEPRHLCQQLAKHYYNGDWENFPLVKKEVLARNYGEECMETAELHMMQINRNTVPLFRDKLKEIFEPCSRKHNKQ